jgi:tetratricopeptide (TPR) repeat protein
MKINPHSQHHQPGLRLLRRLGPLVLMTLPGCIGAAQSSSAPSPVEAAAPVLAPAASDPLLDDADRALRQGEFADAEFAYTTVLLSAPENVHALLHRAVARLARGNRAGAVADAELALTRTTGSTNAFVLALEVLGRAGRCSTVLEQSHERIPDTLLATCLAQTGDLTAALRTVETQSVRRPEDLNTLGIILQSQGDSAGAESAWRDALAAEAGMLDALRNLGALLYAQGRIDEAVPLLQRYLVDVPPGTSDAPRIRGMLNRNDE